MLKFPKQRAHEPMNLHWVFIVMATSMLVACQRETISGVQGWAGPETTVQVNRSGAQVTMQCPTGGWRLTIDRVEQTETTATLYMTAYRPKHIVTQRISPVHVHWAAETGAPPDCVQAMIRFDRERWLPVAEGCR